MPRPNQPRSIASERALARRIAMERGARGWSYDGLALRMTKAGCAIQSSAIYKIERADPPRRITVDELVGFSQVFGIPPEELLLPPEVKGRSELVRLLLAWDAARIADQHARAARDEAWKDLREFVAANPDLEDAIEKAIQAWAEFYEWEDEQSRELGRLRLLADLTGAQRHERSFAERLKKAVD